MDIQLLFTFHFVPYCTLFLRLIVIFFLFLCSASSPYSPHFLSSIFSLLFLLPFPFISSLPIAILLISFRLFSLSMLFNSLVFSSFFLPSPYSSHIFSSAFFIFIFSLYSSLSFYLFFPSLHSLNFLLAPLPISTLRLLSPLISFH